MEHFIQVRGGPGPILIQIFIGIRSFWCNKLWNLGKFLFKREQPYCVHCCMQIIVAVYSLPVLWSRNNFFLIRIWLFWLFRIRIRILFRKSVSASRAWRGKTRILFLKLRRDIKFYRIRIRIHNTVVYFTWLSLRAKSKVGYGTEL
jgi:hypothetical protein